MEGYRNMSGTLMVGEDLPRPGNRITLNPAVKDVEPDKETLRKLGSEGRTFTPAMEAGEREKRLKRWRRAVQAVIAAYRDEG